MNLSRDELIAIAAGCILLVSTIWLIAARRRRTRSRAKTYTGAAALVEPLISDEEGQTYAIKSRARLATRQLACYVVGLFYLVSATVFAVRALRGGSGMRIARGLRAGAGLFRFAAWVVAARADAAEYSRPTGFLVMFVVASALAAFGEWWTGPSAVTAPSLWVLVAHGPLLVAAALGYSTDAAGDVVRDKPPSPEEKAVECHEIIGFTWLSALFARKAQLGLENLNSEDLPAQVAGDRVDATWPALQRLLEEHPDARAGPPCRARTLNLFWVFTRLCRAHFIAAGFCRLLYVFSGYLQPAALYVILKRFGRDDALGWTAVGLLFFGPVINACADALQMFVQRRVATRCRGAIMVWIYDKAARVDMAGKAPAAPAAAAPGKGPPPKAAAGGGGRVGEVVGLMSADVQNVLTAIAYFHWTWGPVLQLALTLSALFWLVGTAAVGALVVIVLNSVGNKRLFGLLAAANKAFLKARNTRLELITEMLQGSRIIKMLSYESGIFASIKKRRDAELGKLNSILNLQIFVFTLINATPPVMGVATFLTLTAIMGRRIDAATGFTALSLLDNLRFVLMQAPSAATFLITGYVSLQRVEAFMDAPEVDEKPSGDGLEPGEVAVEDADFRWGGAAAGAAAGAAGPTERAQRFSETGDVEERNPLRDDAPDAADPNARGLTLARVDVKFRRGELVLVAGVTGAGKSSLLAALLGEIRCLRGSVKVAGATAFCPQQAWCQNATLKDNITFGAPPDDARFARCVDACALGPDIASFPAGDATEVGERGVTLSGGQQARVALARALYADADVYLLDDPLSAVDAHVGEHLLRRAVREELVAKGKTVVLATHQVSLCLPAADRVVLLRADGTVAFSGAPAALARDAEAGALLDELADPEASGSKAPAPKAPEAAEAKKPGGEARLVEEEKRQKGAPLVKNFRLYLSAAGCFFAAGSSLFMVQQPIKYVQASALTDWIARMEGGARPLQGGGPSLYLVWTAVFVAQTALAILCQNTGALRASRKIHKDLAWSVLRNPTAWFDASPVGRVQNRFATDIQAVDRSVSMTTMFLIRSIVAPLVSLFAIGREVPWLLPCFVPVLLIAFGVARNYLLLARDLKRIDSTTKSPLYALFNESLNGLSVLRAFDGAFPRFADRFAGLVNGTNSAELHLFALSYWLSVRLNTLGSTVAGATALALYSRSISDAGALSAPNAGLVLTYAISFTAAIIGLLRTYTELELSMNAVERISEYLDLPEEPPLELPSDDAGFLRETPGAVEFRDVVLAYPRQPEPALRHLSLTVEAGSSVGVVGRTGAGKSTLVQSILRMYPIQGGAVLIDGVDVASVGLKALRGRIAMVPQAPTLFAGTIRFNLDMFGERTDEELAQALEFARGAGLSASQSQQSLASLPSASSLNTLDSAERPAGARVAALSLDFELSEFGTNLSVGERQLICLARAIARRSRLVLMDEATANVDQATDRNIQRVLNSGALSSATRITIAHRLGTIAACDKVLVLDRGSKREYASPSALLADSSSMFYAMCEAAGSRVALTESAKKADAKRAKKA